jgi:sugar-specific transcriptional regulator TrmB
MNKIHKSLTDLGLTPFESALYLAALEIGESGMSDLAYRAGMKRTTAYVTAQSLESKGLLGSFQVKGRTKYVASSPETLKRKNHQQSLIINDLLPQLNALNSQNEEVSINFYRGREGYVNATEATLDQTDSVVRHIGSLAFLHDVIGLDYDKNHYIPERLKRKIRFQGIYCHDDRRIINEIGSDEDQLREVRYLPPGTEFSSSTLISDQQVAIFSRRDELSTIIISSASIVESEKTKFDLLWNYLS